MSALVSLPSSAAEVHVSPDGDDTGPGTQRRPFATLERARDAVRDSGATGAILLHRGVYRLASTLKLDGRDNGLELRPMEAATVALTGGVDVDLDRLPQLKDPKILERLPEDTRRRVRVLDLSKLVPRWKPDKPWPDTFRGYAGWPEVFIDDEPLRLARWPNEGYAKTGKIVDPGSKPRFQEKPDRPGTFQFKEPEPATWSTDQEIFLSGYWCYSWYDEVLRVAAIDREQKHITFARPHVYGIGGPDRPGLYFAINVLETLDQEGEYVYDRAAGKIYLVPPGSDRNTCTVSILSQPLIEINRADGIRISRIDLTAGRNTAVEVSDCTNTVIEQSTVRNFGRAGILIRGGSRCGVTGSRLYGLGKGGVIVSGGDRDTLTPAGHFVTDCHIHNYARLEKTYQPAIALRGVGNRAAYNFIHDAPHCAVLFGGNDHQLEHNRIERVCLDTGDAGAFYSGRDWTTQGTVIQKNYFSDLGESYHHRTWAIYPDDQQSGLIIRHNIVVDCPSGFLVGGGRDHVIKENLFVDVGKWPIRFDARGTTWGIRCEPTLLKRLASVPTDKEPWRSRFPTLVGLAEDPKRNWPVGNTVSGNISVNSQPDSIDAKVIANSKVEPTTTITNTSWKPLVKEGRLIMPTDGPDLPEEFADFHVGPR